MKKMIAVFICIMLFNLHDSFSQNQVITQKDSLEILDLASLQVSYFEIVLNYLADPQSKIKDGVQKNSYRKEIEERVFEDANVMIEDDLNPAIHSSLSTPSFLSAESYCQKFREMYLTEDPRSIQFRVSRIRNLIRTDDGFYAKIFFESTFSGYYQPIPGLNYQQTNRIATIKIESKGKEWRAYITKIAFATSEEIAYYVPEAYKEHMAKMKELGKQN